MEKVQSDKDWSTQVAIVTGAGRGLGRAYAMALAQRGVRVLVNDTGGTLDGRGRDPAVAQAVVEAIIANGGQALASSHDVCDPQEAAAMVAVARNTWGRIDILIHNAAILRDRTFANLSLDDFRAPMEVVFMGAVHACKAMWSDMVAQRYGRVVLTTAATGLFGQYGQTNFAAANMAVVGFMQSLGLEGERHGIRVNCIAPSAATRMTEGIVPEEVMGLLTCEAVVPALWALVGPDAPQRMLLCGGAGSFETAHMVITPGKFLGRNHDTEAALMDALPEITQLPSGIIRPGKAEGQITNEVWNAMAPIDAVDA